MRRLSWLSATGCAFALAIAPAACKKESESEPAQRNDPTANERKPPPMAARAMQERPPASPHGEMPPGHGDMPPGHGDMAGHGAMAEHGGATVGDDGRMAFASFSLAVPASWEVQPVQSRMRVAQLAIPAAKGAEAGELVVFHFGPGGAGGVEANLDRWYGQFNQADGSTTKDKAKVTEAEVAGMKVTSVDVSGHYVAAMQPGAAAKHDNPGYRMLAAIVEAPDGAYYLKAIGPEATLAAAKPAFDAMIASIQAN